MAQKVFLVKIRETLEVEKEVFVNAEDREEAKDKALRGEIFAPASARSKVVSREFVGYAGSTATMEAQKPPPEKPEDG